MRPGRYHPIAPYCRRQAAAIAVATAAVAAASARTGWQLRLPGPEPRLVRRVGVLRDARAGPGGAAQRCRAGRHLGGALERQLALVRHPRPRRRQRLRGARRRVGRERVHLLELGPAGRVQRKRAVRLYPLSEPEQVGLGQLRGDAALLLPGHRQPAAAAFPAALTIAAASAEVCVWTGYGRKRYE